MVSDQEIASCVQSLLRQSAPGGAAVNVAGVVQQLEAKLGLNLSHKRGFIHDQINLLLCPQDGHHALYQHQPPPPPSLQQQHHHHLQPQFLGAHPHQLLQHPEIATSPFTHLPPHHELTFQCAPAVAMQAHQLQQQQAQLQLQRPVAKQEEHVAPGGAATTGAKESAATGSKRRGGPGGLSKLCGVSPELQAIVGEPAMPRTQIVKQLWAYIRKNNLQDPSNKRKIICNDQLRLVFETDCTDMFKMNKLLAKHIIPLEPTKDPGPRKKKLKATEASSVTEADASQVHVVISEDLAKFFGSGERQMLQSEALKRFWDYVDIYQLKDPLDPKMVKCDGKLQQLFGRESLSALEVSEMLACHLFKQS